jgi:putative transposase
VVIEIPLNGVRHYLWRAAHRELMSSVEHRSHKFLDNRADNSHQRERAMKYFRSRRETQKFLAAFSAISPHFRPGET